MARELSDKFVYQDQSEVVWLSPCGDCKWKWPGYASCYAFPDAIPDDILMGRHLHRIKYPGQVGDWLYEKR